MRMKFTVDSKSKNLVKFEDMENGQVFRDDDSYRYYIKCEDNLENGLKSNILNLTTMTTGKIIDEKEEYTLVDAEIIIKEDWKKWVNEHIF